MSDNETWWVIENTPGYMPDNEPADFTTYAEAVAYANELCDELAEQGYEVDRGWASEGNYFAAHATTKDKIHDLGRTVCVERSEGDY